MNRTNSVIIPSQSHYKVSNRFHNSVFKDVLKPKEGTQRPIKWLMENAANCTILAMCQ